VGGGIVVDVDVRGHFVLRPVRTEEVTKTEIIVQGTDCRQRI
jgi:hypothetical protein